MRLLVAASWLCLALVVAACGGESSTPDEIPTTAAADEFGAYPADESLDEEEAVEAYVAALDERDGARFCSVVAPWISGMFDIYGTDPEAPVSKPLECPEFVSGFIGYIEDCCPQEFLGAEIVEVGEFDRRGDLVGVPIEVRLEVETDGRKGVESIDDIVWVTRDAGAWRVAKLSLVAARASIGLQSEGDLTTPPDLPAVKSAFATAVEEALARRRAYDESYREVGGDASCPGTVAYDDGANDVVDYQHPAPPTPTPQLPAADLRAVRVHGTEEALCVVFEVRGDAQAGSIFDVAIQSPDFEWGRRGFSQGFEVDLRADGRARVTSGLDDDRRAISVPADVGRDGAELALRVDRASFTVGQPLAGSVAPSRPLTRFQVRADVTVEVSEERLLHDDLGPGPPEGTRTYPYP